MAAGAGVIVNDLNHNGRVDGVGEMLGSFAQLATYDTNHDGVVNAQDTNFSDIKVWQDTNNNGVADAGELQSVITVMWWTALTGGVAANDNIRLLSYSVYIPNNFRLSTA